MKIKARWEDLDADVRTILKRILNKVNEELWSRFMWLWMRAYNGSL